MTGHFLYPFWINSNLLSENMIATFIEIYNFSNTSYFSKLKILIMFQFQKRGTKNKSEHDFNFKCFEIKKKLYFFLSTSSKYSKQCNTLGNIPCSWINLILKCFPEIHCKLSIFKISFHTSHMSLMCFWSVCHEALDEIITRVSFSVIENIFHLNPVFH